RQLGAGAGPTLASRPASDPRLKELTDEILRLSTEFGIMSEYTSFLATEGTDLSDWNRLSEGCGAELQNRAVQMRCGVPAVTQSLNYNERKIRTRVDYRNEFWNENLDRVEVSTVQQVCDRAFFRNGSRWVDAALIQPNAGLEPDEIVEFGSPAHRRMIE